MSNQIKFQTGGRGKAATLFTWGVVLAGTVLAGWIWWRSAKAGTGARVQTTNMSVVPQAKTTAQKTARREVSSLPDVQQKHPEGWTPNKKEGPRPIAVIARGQEQAVSVPSLPSVPSIPAVVSPPSNPATNTATLERNLRLQVALIAQGISPGSVDGVMGTQTRAALKAFQRKQGLPATGQLDEATSQGLKTEGQYLIEYVVTEQDVARLQPLGTTWLAKSQQTSLEYETVLELVGEKSQASPTLLRRLNPEVSWESIAAGAKVKLPATAFPEPAAKAALARIYLSERMLEVFDEATNLLAHFPCSIGQKAEKRPVGELHVAVLALNPNYTFDPEVFPESEEGRELGRKLILQPGPNNPVGTVWIGLDKPGYGIHGTPKPEQVGRTESHGCFRLANWNAEYFARLVWVGMPVVVEN